MCKTSTYHEPYLIWYILEVTALKNAGVLDDLVSLIVKPCICPNCVTDAVLFENFEPQRSCAFILNVEPCMCPNCVTNSYV